MLRRNILSLAAVKKVREGTLNIETVAIEALGCSFPQALVSEAIKPEILHAAHNIAKGMLTDAQDRNLLKVMACKDDLDKLVMGIKLDIKPSDLASIFGRYYNNIKSRTEKIALSTILLCRVLHKDLAGKFTTDVLATMSKDFRNILATSGDHVYSYGYETIRSTLEANSMPQLQKLAAMLLAAAKAERHNYYGSSGDNTWSALGSIINNSDKGQQGSHNQVQWEAYKGSCASLAKYLRKFKEI
jgi:hypothetical protein